MSDELALRYGPLMPSLGVQLVTQGFDLRPDLMLHFEEDRTAIQRLYLRNLLTTAQKESALKKLHKRIIEEVNKAYGERSQVES